MPALSHVPSYAAGEVLTSVPGSPLDLAKQRLDSANGTEMSNGDVMTECKQRIQARVSAAVPSPPPPVDGTWVSYKFGTIGVTPDGFSTINENLAKAFEYAYDTHGYTKYYVIITNCTEHIHGDLFAFA